MLTESGGSGATADVAGDPLLRAAIAEHLRSSRGADCEPSQVVVLSGAVIGIGAAARLWLGPDRRAVVEDPGDAVLARALGLSGATLVPVATDGNGLQPDRLPDEAAVAVVSPTVHVPTGASMPLARRVRILAWAATAGTIVIEDARADDLILRGAPPACLQGLDTDGRVIHLGGFESLLHGGVRLAYAVLPPAFVEPFVAALDAIDPGPSPVQQRALGRFLVDGLLRSPRDAGPPRAARPPGGGARGAGAGAGLARRGPAGGRWDAARRNDRRSELDRVGRRPGGRRGRRGDRLAPGEPARAGAGSRARRRLRPPRPDRAPRGDPGAREGPDRGAPRSGPSTPRSGSATDPLDRRARLTRAPARVGTCALAAPNS